MRSLVLLTATATVAAVLVASQAHATTDPSKTLASRSSNQIVSLRRAISWHRTRTWSYQDRIGIKRTPTRYRERSTLSVLFLHWIDRRWSQRRIAARRRYRSLVAASAISVVPSIICRVFGSASPEALLVARRESGFDVRAHNGQYLGIFQMGSSERARFATIGYSTAYQQIVAAHNYFLVSGWGPWSATAY